MHLLQAVVTDVCVPISHLPQLVTAAKEDAISSNLISTLF